MVKLSKPRRASRTAPLWATLLLAAAPALAQLQVQGDTNCDGTVDYADVATVLANQGMSGKVTVMDGDVNRDRVVDGADTTIVLSNYGQSDPPIPAVPGISVTATMDAQNMVTVIDDETGRVIISPNLHQVWEANASANPQNPPLAPQIDFKPRVDGYDINFTFANDGATPRSLGTIFVPGIRFGSTIVSRDFARDGKEYNIVRPAGQNYFGGGNFYPHGYYAPIKIVRSVVGPFDPAGVDEYTIGVSLHYPILKYKHAVWMRTDSPGGQYTHGGQNWEVRLELNPAWSTANLTAPYNPDGDLQPGETRTYTLAVRVMKNSPTRHPGDWMRLFVPYKRYFRCLYGMPRYTADTRPVCCITTTQVSACGPSSPMGFINAALRPDVHGWKPWVVHWTNIAADGWGRFMVWTPTGLYCTAQHNNFPFQFTSHWQDVPAMATSLSYLSGFAAGTADLGLWWGRAVQVMREWEDPLAEPLDPEDSEHAELAKNELTGAADAGATTVGLDAFSYMAMWDSYWWLQDMQETFPGMSFITEPVHADFIHTLAPTYLLGTRPAAHIGLRTEVPHFLGDFLLPGREVWAAIHQQDLRDELGHWPDDDEIRAAILRYAEDGYVPAPFADPAIDATYNAQPTWLTTVPADLQP